MGYIMSHYTTNSAANDPDKTYVGSSTAYSKRVNVRTAFVSLNVLVCKDNITRCFQLELLTYITSNR